MGFVSLDSVADAIASSVGGIVSAVVPYPVELVKNRVATADLAGTGSPTFAVVKEVWEQGGFSGFYQGVSPSALGNAVEKFIYFFAYSGLRRQITQGGTQLAMWRDVLSGALADLCHMPVTLPVDTLLVRMAREKDPSKSSLKIAKEVAKEKGGILGFYKGIMAMTVLTIKPGLQLAVFEAIKSRILLQRRRSGVPGAELLSGSQAFLLGALARAVATIIVFPYIRGKVMLQRGEEANGNPLVALHRVMFNVAKRDGFAGLYQGMPQELLRATMSAALMFAVRERLTYQVKRAIVGTGQSR